MYFYVLKYFTTYVVCTFSFVVGKNDEYKIKKNCQ